MDICGILYEAKNVSSESGKLNGISIDRLYNDSVNFQKLFKHGTFTRAVCAHPKKGVKE